MKSSPSQSETDVSPESWNGLSESQQLELTEILDWCLAEFEAGRPIDDADILARHPDLAHPLKEHLASIRYLCEAASGYRPDFTEATATDRPESIGEYRIVREIGRGGMGVVYEAEDISLRRRVALKVLPFAALLDQKQIARFRNEAQAAGQLHHPHIVPVYAVGCDRGVHYFAMQLVEGQPLDVAIAQMRASTDGSFAGHQAMATTVADPVLAAGEGGERSDHVGRASQQVGLPAIEPESDRQHDNLSDDASEPASHGTASSQWTQAETAAVPPFAALSTSPWKSFTTSPQHHGRDYLRTVAMLGADVADALQHAHDVGILHRDIKPSNLLLDRAGKVWISDFGLAHLPSDQSMTMTGDIMGTVNYMSPEQALGRSQFIDHRTDIYSLGITLYELATLRRAFPADNREEFLAKIASAEPPSPRRWNKSIPVDLETIILKAISKEASDRYASAAEFADDLRRFLAGRATVARRPSWLDHLSKWAKRHRTAVAITAGILVVAAISATAVALRLADERSQTLRALAAESRQTKRAEQHFALARNAVDRLGTDLAIRLRRVPGSELVRRDLLETTLKFYQSFLDLASGPETPKLAEQTASAELQIARLHEQLGEGAMAMASYDRAADRLSRILDGTNREPLHADHRAMISKDDHATTLQWRDRVTALSAQCLNNRSLLHQRLGNSQMARADIESSLALYRRLQKNHDADAADFTADLAHALCNRSVILRRSGDSVAARADIEQAIVLLRTLVADDATIERIEDLAVSLQELAFQVVDAEPILADRACREAIELHEELVARDPQAISYQRDLSLAYNNLGSIARRQGDQEASVEAYQKAASIGEQVVVRAPLLAENHVDWAVTLNNLGRARLALADASAAFAAFSQAASILQSLIERHGETAEYLSLWGGVLFNQGVAALQREPFNDALVILGEANERQRRSVQLGPENSRFVEDFDTQLSSYAEILRKHQRYELAMAACHERAELTAGDVSLEMNKRDATQRNDKIVDIAQQMEQIAKEASHAAFAGELTESTIEKWRGEARRIRNRL